MIEFWHPKENHCFEVESIEAEFVRKNICDADNYSRDKLDVIRTSLNKETNKKYATLKSSLLEVGKEFQSHSGSRASYDIFHYWNIFVLHTAYGEKSSQLGKLPQSTSKIQYSRKIVPCTFLWRSSYKKQGAIQTFTYPFFPTASQCPATLVVGSLNCYCAGSQTSNMMAELQASFCARWDLTEHIIGTVRPPGYTILSAIKKGILLMAAGINRPSNFYRQYGEC